jgi:hypothetical protein
MKFISLVRCRFLSMFTAIWDSNPTWGMDVTQEFTLWLWALDDDVNFMTVLHSDDQPGWRGYEGLYESPVPDSHVLMYVSIAPLHVDSRGHLKCEGTRTLTRFRLSAKRTSLFKSGGGQFQSTIGSRGVRISSSNTGYTMFRGSVKGTGYPLHSTVSPSLTHGAS